MNIRTSNVTALLILVSQILCAQFSLDTANSAYFNLRVVEAKESYEKVWTSPKSINEKTEAGKQLVKISWQIYNDYEMAREYSEAMLTSDPDNFDVPYQMAGISIEAVKFDDAGKYLEDDTDLLFSTELAAGVAFDFPDYSLRAWLLFLCHSELKLALSYTLKCLS